MMLSVAAQVGRPLALPLYFLRQGKSCDLPVPPRRRFVVIDKEIYRTDAGDLEGLGKQQAVNIIFKRH